MTTETQPSVAHVESAEHIDSVTELDLAVGEPTGETYKGLPVLEDVGHPLVPTLTHGYYDSELRGETTLLETIGFTMNHDDYGTLLVGETGCGKNTAVAQICAKTNRPMVRVNFGIDVTYDELVGHYAPNPDSGTDDPTFAFLTGLLKWCVESGAVFVADELNAATGEATMPLHGVIEEQGKRELVVRETGEVITPHPEFKFVATMNPLGYSGTKDLNQAFKDRFFPIMVDYMQPDDEIALLGEKEQLDEAEAQMLVSLANKLRDRLKNGDIMTPISTRELLKIAALRNLYDLRDAAHIVLDGVATETDRDVISTLIDRHIADEEYQDDDDAHLGGITFN